MKKRYIFSKDKKDIYCFADTIWLCKTLLESGAKIIQLRSKTIDDGTFYNTAKKMLSVVRSYDETALIINDRVDIAIDIGADGVHVGRQDENYHEVIKRVPEKMIVGVSAKTPEEAVDAELAGAAYLGVGAVFPTSTKKDTQVIGLDGLSKAIKAVNIPVAAIGGISLDNIHKVIKAGANYFAVVSQINNAKDIFGRLREFLTLIKN